MDKQINSLISALKINESLFYELAELIPLPVSIHKNGAFVYMNKQGLGMMKVESLSQINGKPAREVAHPDFLEGIIEKMMEAEKTGDIVEIKNVKLIDLAGNTLIVEFRVKSIEINNEKYVLSIVQDTTERVNYEKELQDSREQYRILSELTTDAATSSTIETDGSIKRDWAIDKILNDYGYTFDDIDTFEKWAKIVHPDDLHNFYKCVEEFKTKRKISTDLKIITKYGETKWVNNSVFPYTDPVTGKTKLLSAVKDITERKKIESEREELIKSLKESMLNLEQKSAKIQELNISLEESTIKLMELNASKDKFFSIISHDLKNPFSSFLYLTELLLNNYQSLTIAEFNNSLQNLNQSANKLYKLLINLLQWSQVQLGTIKFNPDSYILRDIIRMILDYLNNSAIEKGITIENNISENISIFADINMADSIFRNLIHNAIKFTDTCGKIIINACISDDKIVVSIKDSGIGIPLNMQSKLFIIEEKTSTQGTKGEEGSGLGLILCKEFISKHLGSIHLESEQGKGTTFFVEFPAKSS